MESQYKELLDILGKENNHVKKAITFLLHSNINELDEYKQKQRFAKLETEENEARIDYESQQIHAIDWLISKTLWEKAKGNNELNLSNLIKNIQCAPLILYLAIATEVLPSEDEKIRNYVNTITDKVQKCMDLTSRNIRFKEKNELLDIINNDNWENIIADTLTRN